MNHADIEDAKRSHRASPQGARQSIRDREREFFTELPPIAIAIYFSMYKTDL